MAASVTGNVVLPASGKVLAGTTYGVSGTGSTAALILPAAANVLTGSGSYGDPSAAVTPSLAPDFPDVANVLTSDTVNGVAGSLTLPLANSVLASAGVFGVGGNGSTPTLTPPPATDAYSGVSFGLGGSGSTGTLTLASAANVRTGQGAFGRGGNSVTPTLADCQSDGGNGCVTTSPYLAANTTGLAAKRVFGTTAAVRNKKKLIIATFCLEILIIIYLILIKLYIDRDGCLRRRFVKL